jgi:hypothetical protein
MEPSRRSLLAIYLNDHLAGATAGDRLLRRAAREHRDDAIGAELGRLAQEVAQDRRTLMRIMTDLGAPVSRLRVGLGRLAETAGRVKLNGRVLSRSPLSDLLEVEAMQLGVEGKAAAWRTLGDLAHDEPRLDRRQLDRLLERAGAQIEALERLRIQSASRAWDAPRTP